MRRLAAFAALLALGACGGQGGNEQAPVNPPPQALAPPAPAPELKANAAAEQPAAAAPGLAEMSPSRRRAYDRGFSDCRAGRYDPDPYPEAYRIGCAAANDR